MSDDPSPAPGTKGGRPSLVTRIWKWVARRTGADQILRSSLDEPIPGGARFAYVFGSALLFIFISQIVTGLCLALYYAPSPMTAHVSVAYIVKEVAAGSFLRSLHSYGSSAMVVVLLLHFCQTLLYGSYKGKREFLWMSGCVLALLVLGMTFTGYLLRWDQKAYFAGSVGTDIVGQVPVIGESLRLLLRGGPRMGALTLSRFYSLHVFVIPAAIFAFIAMHLLFFRKAGAAGPLNEDPVTPRQTPEMFYPRQVLIDMAFVFFVMGLLGMLAHFIPISLGPEANPANSRYLPRPEWYYLPMFQWLKYWEGWRTVIGVVVIPGILIALVFLLPFMDRGRERRPWRRPIPVVGVFVVLIGLLWLGLTSRLEDSRDPAVASQIAQQNQQEDTYFHAPFQPYSAAPSGGTTPAPLNEGSAIGKSAFDSHGCSGCHGANGKGAAGPALTNVASRYPPAQLTALLKAPTSKMKAAGMVPLTLSAAEMTALVSYMTSLGGAPTPSAAPPSTAGSPSPSPSGTQPGVTAAPATAPGVAASHAAGTSGKAIFDSHGCSGCHGKSGGGGAGPSLTHISSKYPPAQLTALLKAPTAKMKAAGMVPLTLSAADMKALGSYLTSLRAKSASPATPSAPGSSSPATAQAQPAPAPGQPALPAPATPAPAASKPGQPPHQSQVTASRAPGTGASAGPAGKQGKTIFDAKGCASCHGAGGTGGRAPALTKIGKTMAAGALAGVLQHPTAKMKAGGMPPLHLAASEMSALVAYLRGLGSPAAAQASAGAPTPGPSTSTVSPPVSGRAAGSPVQPPINALESSGALIFKAHRCGACHGIGGVGGTAAAPSLAGAGASLAPALVTTMLQHPTARMHQGGMPPVSLTDDELKALAAYVSRISGAKAKPQ